MWVVQVVGALLQFNLGGRTVEARGSRCRAGEGEMAGAGLGSAQE